MKNLSLKQYVRIVLGVVAIALLIFTKWELIAIMAAVTTVYEWVVQEVVSEKKIAEGEAHAFKSMCHQKDAEIQRLKKK